MPKQLFSSAVNTTPYTVGDRKWYLVPVSVAVHAAVLASVVVVPLVAANMLLPTPRRDLVHLMASAVPLPPPPSNARPPVMIEPSPGVDIDAAPLFAPEGVAEEPMLPLVNLGPSRAQDLAGGRASMRAAPPPPPVQIPAAPIRPGGQIQEPRKIWNVVPVYPAIARAARATGIVIIEATIDKAGHVRDARVLRSAPLLDSAALEAVRQWRYTPTLLNGEPVEVIMTVTVQFGLN